MRAQGHTDFTDACAAANVGVAEDERSVIVAGYDRSGMTVEFMFVGCSDVPRQFLTTLRC